jgi:hypothetical protein
VYGRMGKTKGFIKPLALGWPEGWVDGWAVCEVWADGWAEGEGKGGI